MKRILLVLSLVGFAIGMLGVAWVTHEAIPDGAADLASDIDTFIKNFKIEVRQRLEPEHIFGTSTDDNGLHTLGSARCFIQNAAPTDISGGTAALGQYNAASSTDGGTALTTEELGSSTADIGAGRCWIDLDGPDNVAATPDDRSLATWDETNNRWVYVDVVDPTVAVASQRFFSSTENLIYHGSFEMTDGTGLVASIVEPSGWTNNGTATIGYTSPPAEATEGEGVTVTVTDSGTGGDSISQVLSLIKASTTYYVIARVDAAAATECRLSTSGAATDITAGATLATSTATTTTSVSGTFVTAAALDTVTIILESEAAADACTWDHVGVYELSTDKRRIPAPGIAAAYTTNIVSDATIDTTFGNNAFVATTINIPGPGYIVVADGSVSLNTNSNDGACMARLVRDDCAGGAFSAVSPVAFVHAGNFLSGGTVSLNYVDTAPVVGGACIYRIEVREDGTIQDCEVNDTNLGNNTVQTGTSLRLLLLPVR